MRKRPVISLPKRAAPTTARAARSEAERAERGAGQMRPCTPLTFAPAPRESAFKPVPHPAAPVGQSSQTRRHHLTPTPVQQLCTPVQSCGQKRSFLLNRARPVFFSGKTEKKMGGASRLDKPPAGAESPWPPDGGPNFHGRFVTSLTRSRGGHTIGPPRAVAPTGARNGFTPARRCAPADNPW